MKYVLSLLLICSCILVAAQEKDLVATQGITSDLHRTNIGKIVFTNRKITTGAMLERDFLDSCVFNWKTTLYMTAFMDNSLLNRLHQLSPQQNEDELYRNGNYQFSFYVDQKCIYQENLNYGAGLPQNKSFETILTKPLASYPESSGLWSEFLFERFMNNGGKVALTEGKHLLKIELRPYLNGDKLLTGHVIASGSVVLNVKRIHADLGAIQVGRPQPYIGFPLSEERYDTLLIRKLKQDIAEGTFRKITSVAVIKNGKLLIEEYFNGADRQTLHDTRSVGKSFAGTLTGMAIADGYLKNENQQLREFYRISDFAHQAAEKENTSLKALLTMSSAFEGNDSDSNSPGNEENMYPTEDWVKFALDLPVTRNVQPAGWHYFTAGVVILGDVLNKKVPGGLEQYAAKRLFMPLGITNYKWEYTPQKVANTAGGLKMNTLDYAKYGQLYLNNGSWMGKRLLTKDWVKRSFSRQFMVPDRDQEYYGYLFWNKTYQVAGKNYETYYSSGNGGNKIYVFKDQPLVVVITATAYGTPYAHRQNDQMMEKYILPAVIK